MFVEFWHVLSPEHEESHIGELCIAPLNLTPHFHTYHRSTCKCWWDSDAPEVIPRTPHPPKRRSVGNGDLPLQKSSKCYDPNVRKVTPVIYVLHHLVNHTLQHTSTHIIQKYLRNETKRLEKEEQHMKKT